MELKTINNKAVEFHVIFTLSSYPLIMAIVPYIRVSPLISAEVELGDGNTWPFTYLYHKRSIWSYQNSQRVHITSSFWRRRIGSVGMCTRSSRGRVLSKLLLHRLACYSSPFSGNLDKFWNSSLPLFWSKRSVACSPSDSDNVPGSQLSTLGGCWYPLTW